MPGNSIPIVMYHHVSPEGKELNVPPEIFEDHLRVLHSEGWKTLSGKEFLHYLQDNKLPEKGVLLTFDDGFVDNYLYAYPLLKRYNMKAMLFVATSFIEHKDIKRVRLNPLPHKECWHLAFTERRSEVMCTWKELKEMENSGVFDIQAHGHLHKSPRYIKERKYSELREDLFFGKKILEERLSKEVFHLGWPKGCYDREGIKIATEVGFKALYTTERGANTARNLRALKRLSVKRNGKWLANRLNIYSSVLLSKLYLAARIGK